MRTKTKIWLIIAASLVLIGCIIWGGVMAIFKWDFSKLSTVKYETNTYEISEVFDSISMITDTANITFAVSDDEKCRVVCYEAHNAKHSVSVQDRTLHIDLYEDKAWYDYIGIQFGTPKITVYLPQTEYASVVIQEDTGDIEVPEDFKFKCVDIALSTGDVNFFASASESVKIKTSTGKIYLDNICAETLDLSASTGDITISQATCAGDVTVNVSTGKVKLTDITCNNLISSGSTGDISLKNVIAKEKLSITRSTGDVRLEGSDASELFVATDTGSVTGSLLSDKVFLVETDTGDINVPKTTSGGKCEIHTDTGSIKITVE